MALRDKRLDAPEIQALAARLKSRYSTQNKWDQLQIDFVTMTNTVTVNSPGVPNNGVKGVRSGLGGYVVRENAQLVRGTPLIHLNIPDNDEKMRDWAGSTGEPWLTAALIQSQRGGKTWARQPTDLFTVGRAWSYCSAIPSEYDSPEYKEMVEAYADADPESEEYRTLKAEIKKYKQACLPIIWRYVSPRQTWLVRDAVHPLPLVVEIRKMHYDDIKSEFGEEACAGHKRGDTPIEVIHYANHMYCGTVVSGQKAENATLAKDYEHGMGMNPYTLVEGELLPENENGVEWAGSIFHSLDTLETMDEILSDLRHNHREWTLAPIVQTFDPDLYDETTKVQGRPKTITIKGAAELSKWKDETWDLAPVPQLNQQSIYLLEKLEEMVTQQLIFDVRRGEAKSGTSNVLGTSLVQISERKFNPYLEALNDAYENVCKLHIRSLSSLNREYPDSPDDVYVFPNYKGSGAIGTSPKDWVGWENAIQCRLDRALDVEESQKIGNAERMIAMGMAPEAVMEEFLGRENAAMDIQRGHQSALQAGMRDQTMQAILALSGNAISQLAPEEMAEFQDLMANDPELQNLVAGLPATIPGNQRQANSNSDRMGVPIAPQEQTQPMTQQMV